MCIHLCMSLTSLDDISYDHLRKDLSGKKHEDFGMSCPMAVSIYTFPHSEVAGLSLLNESWQGLSFSRLRS